MYPGVDQASVKPGDVVVVHGAGAVGIISAQLASLLGATVVLCGHSEHRLLLGKQLGASYTLNLGEVDLCRAISDITGGEGCDVFIECSGTGDAVSLGLSTIRPRGEFLQLGLFGQPHPVNFDDITRKEIVITSGFGQNWTSWERALRLMSNNTLNLGPLITHRFPLSEWEEAFRIADERRGLKVAFDIGPPQR